MDIDANEIINDLSMQIANLTVQLSVANATIRKLQEPVESGQSDEN